MTLTSQRARTLRTIRQGNTTLLLNINRALGLSRLRLGLILLLLFLRLFIILILISLALLAFLGPVLGALNGALLSALLALHRIVPGIRFFASVVILANLRPVRRVASFFLLARLLLLGFQTAANVIRRGLFEHRALAMLADDCFEEIVLARGARRKRRGDFII